jgi:hypothetical protein
MRYNLIIVLFFVSQLGAVDTLDKLKLAIKNSDPKGVSSVVAAIKKEDTLLLEAQTRRSEILDLATHVEAMRKDPTLMQGGKFTERAKDFAGGGGASITGGLELGFGIVNGDPVTITLGACTLAGGLYYVTCAALKKTPVVKAEQATQILDSLNELLSSSQDSH